MGGTDFSLPKFGFGGHKGSKKKKKENKNHSDSESDSDDEHKHKKTDLEFGSDIGLERDLNFKAPRMDTNNGIDLKAGDVSGAIDTPNVDLKTPDSNIDIDADVKVKNQKGGFDINMPHIKMPKFGFGGKGKRSTSDADIDIDVNVNAPSVDDIITPTTEIDVNAEVHSAEIHDKGDGRADFNLPKFGFGGHKGSKKKKKSKKKKDKEHSHSESDSDSDDEHKQKKDDLKFGIDGGIDKDFNVKTPKLDVDNDIDLKSGVVVGSIDTPNVDLETSDANLDIDADTKVKGQKGGIDINMPHIKM